jgi:queuine tRNA-ribosyltransferase/7-cyano-7-deazaguanine tRNA-ribosyltransferase
MFQITSQDPSSHARTGLLTTAHCVVETPSYVVVGTHANVRTLTPTDLDATRTQVVIANTYHLWRRKGKELEIYDGLHNELGWNGSIMTDSGGFQVFSLGAAREHGVSKIANIFPDENKKSINRIDKNLVRITEEGVYFADPQYDDGREEYLDAERSIAIQEKLGADIILAFDECTSPLHSYKYTKEATLRTHRWAKRSLQAHTHPVDVGRLRRQLLYGIVQGGMFEDLRHESGRFIGSLSFDGFAIGGSLGKSRSDMLKVLEWTMPHLPDDRPRHLLGIGTIEDIFACVRYGIDTFDCVIPTREGRHGAIWTRHGRIDITRGVYDGDSTPLEEGCECFVCTTEQTTKHDLYWLFRKVQTPTGWTFNPEGGRRATIHNVFFFNRLMADIRKAINEGRFEEFAQKILRQVL